MEIGLWVDENRPLPEVLAAVDAVASSGVSRLWIAQRFGWDALTVLAAVGGRAPGVQLGTSVAMLFPKHPITLAQEALTVSAATGGRFTLGIGPGHRHDMEGVYGYPWERPADRVRERLQVLMPLLRGAGGSAVAQLSTPQAPPPPVLLSALGPVMLRIAGELADGTITAWAGPRALDEYIVPRLTAAAAGRPTPQVVAGMCVCVTGDAEGARQRLTRLFGRASELPSYRAVLDRSGYATAADAAVVGDEETVARELRRYVDAGATEVQVAMVGSAEENVRTLVLLGDLSGR
ncbi:TIGR03564 family F420-dependent LLM class oxidoreductase [Pseudonocardia sp. TRM90224]|uniref:TIGR03564 family F420-dependent LLM class oxidoreductase n=1 Tax=Pseudonocardia sp. TRM90224 TaxID=2812678 RepID=UPI001E59FDFE|nr:TIGR03564 family F420-dependent LLM class oxidoreductase [Pseudonocardia sp. TRM90224]